MAPSRAPHCRQVVIYTSGSRIKASALFLLTNLLINQLRAPVRLCVTYSRCVSKDVLAIKLSHDFLGVGHQVLLAHSWFSLDARVRYRRIPHRHSPAVPCQTEPLILGWPRDPLVRIIFYYSSSLLESTSDFVWYVFLRSKRLYFYKIYL